jgi:cohesin complex subunit SA-1/2
VVSPFFYLLVRPLSNLSFVACRSFFPAVVSHLLSLFLRIFVLNRVGHCLADSEDIPIEHMKIELTDLVVSSLRAMPEHKSLVTSWPAMLRAIHGASSKQSLGDKDERRKEAAKKRVLLRMLVCAAELEVNDAADDDDSAQNNVDPDILAARKAAQPDAEQPKKKRKVESSKEEFTLALVKALPDLLVSYKEETSVLQSLTTLPRYFRK